ncbi:MAG: HD domain-containing phosphohydrolase [Candidatus Izemoplasmatales bacterium]|jgi:diguanylate cyclase (GGDEF)-like protein/PAS domain S-box-containing protein
MRFLKNPLFIFGVFSFFILIAFSYVFWLSSNYIETRQEQILLMHRDNAVNIIENNFNNYEMTLSSVQNYLSSNPSDSDLLNLLVSIDQESEEISSIYFYRPDLTMVNSSGYVPDPGVDLTSRIWYVMATGSDTFIYTPAYINSSEDRVIVTTAIAVYENNVLAGVLATDIDIMAIAGFVSDMEIGDTGYAFLIDTNGSFIAHPDIDVSDIALNPATELVSLTAGLTGATVNYYITIQGTEGVLAYTTLVGDSYQLGVFMPLAEFTQNLRLLSTLFIIFTVIMVILATVFSLFYSKTIGRPMDRLLNDIRAINLNNDIHYRLPVSKNPFMFGDVRTSLNAALATTAEAMEQNIADRRELAIENQRVKVLMESTADIIFEVDLDKRFSSVFGRGLKKIAMTPEDFIGKTVLDVFGDAGKERDKLYEKALQGEHHIYDWTLVKKDQTLYFEASISPIYDEAGKVTGAVGITRDTTEPMLRQKEVEYLITHDFLTGLYNRRFYVEELTRLDGLATLPLALMMIDFNGLKILNDAYGHHFGDIALKKTSETLCTIAGISDSVCRIGGDEFAIILPKANLEAVEAFKSKIQTELAKILIGNIPISVAVGYDVKLESQTSLEEVMKNAENRMYRNKVTEGRNIRNGAIKAILMTLTDKFSDEKNHSARVGRYCRLIGEAMDIHSDDLRELEVAGLFHDIGKISIPDAILGKPEKLTLEENELIKTHTENGYHILRAADEYSGLAEHVLSHHERWDGKGYPRGLSKTDIPLFSRIIGIAEAYDTMTSDRAYRKHMSDDDAIAEIIRYAGSQFDPNIAKIFVEKVLKKPFNGKSK